MLALAHRFAVIPVILLASHCEIVLLTYLDFISLQVADLSYENFKLGRVMRWWLSRLSSHIGAKSSRERKPKWLSGLCGLNCEVAKHSSFLITIMIGGRRPLPPKICAQSDPGGRQHCVIPYGMWFSVAVRWFRLRTTISVFTLLSSEKRPLRPISAYNVSTVRASEKSSIVTNRK